ncbi:hypothetical protein [Laceyella putida]|uniref:Restriction endonuclease n=1 Tax=Laceyella putida TaxID=110101 RepID=A0ABW2RR07_9BACL
MARKFWTDEMVEQEIKKSMEILGIDRMPTGPELQGIGRNDLHCRISRTYGYAGWAEKQGLTLKSCDTRTGKRYEEIATNLLKDKGYEVERMTTKHPYDLMVKGVVKVDVKVGKVWFQEGKWRIHTFRLEKRFPTSDFYLCIGLNEKEEIEKIFVIPSLHARIMTISAGENSKWDKYLIRFDLLDTYSEFMQGFLNGIE